MGIGLCNIVGDSMSSRKRQSVKCHYSQCLWHDRKDNLCARVNTWRVGSGDGFTPSPVEGKVGE